MTSRPDLTSSSNPSHVRPGSRDWWAGLLREGFGLSFWLFAAFAIGMGLTCYVVLGPEMFDGAMSGSLELVGNTLPRVAAAQFVAGFVWAMLPRDRLSRLADSNHGLRGLVVATAAGIITPGGPTSAFSLLAIVAGAGADRGILITSVGTSMARKPAPTSAQSIRGKSFMSCSAPRIRPCRKLPWPRDKAAVPRTINKP